MLQSAKLDVAVCVCTYRRPKELARLLESLAKVQFNGTVEIVVVDNDPDGPASLETPTILERQIVHLKEPRAGIPYARNTAMAYALERARTIAFVDDDEIVPPGWLSELFYALNAFDADGVAGPVEPQFEVDPPAWIRGGGFFDRPRFRSGDRLPYAGTGNLILKTQSLRRTGVTSFDESLQFSGGSDTEFTSRMVRCGLVLRWQETAKVREIVPEERSNSRWATRRAFRTGLVGTQIELSSNPTRAAHVIVLATAIAKLGLSIVAAAAGLVLARPSLFGRSIRAFLRSVGSLAAVSGRESQEYSRDTRR